MAIGWRSKGYQEAIRRHIAVTSGQAGGQASGRVLSVGVERGMRVGDATRGGGDGGRGGGRPAVSERAGVGISRNQQDRERAADVLLRGNLWGILGESGRILGAPVDRERAADVLLQAAEAGGGVEDE